MEPKSNIEIDKTTFLSSLVSDPRAIEVKLDKLRVITAKMSGSPALSPEDAQAVKALQAEIIDYLINHEPLRKFTIETLQAKIFEHVEGVNTMRILHRTVAVIIGASLLLPVATTFIPLNDATVRNMIVFSSFFALLHLGATWLFLTALKGFKAELQKAYYLICAGMVVLVIGQLLTPLTLIIAPGFAPGWLESGGNLLVFLPAPYLLYAGTHQIAKATNTASLLRSVPLLLGLAVLGSAILLLLPHASVPNELSYDADLVLLLLIVLPNIFAAGLMRKAAKNVTPLYARSMRWLFWFLLIGVLGNGGTLIATLVAYDNISTIVPILSLPFVLSGIFALKAGYDFNKITRYS